VSIFRIGNASQLESFLTILQEESEGREGVLKQRQEAMSKRIQDDLRKYGEISEQEEEEAGEEDEGEDPPADEEGSDLSEPEGDEEGGEPEPAGDEEEQIETSPDVTYYKIRDQINDIRAAPSLKGKEVKQDMEAWLDRLDDSEKELLLGYLATVDQLMRSQVSGTEAQDPSEPPASIDVSSGESDGSEEEPEEDRREEEPAPGEEDTSPPIKAGAGQDLSEVRSRLKQLMRN
tara:strand:- start:5377 stop:6075 length:699 start_codon:yes stop_codon:yes gene_type:complete